MAYTVRPRVFIDFTSNVLATATSYTEVTSYVRGLDFGFGRSRAVDDFQPGGGSMLLDNRDSRFDPSNTSSPYYPNVKLRRRVLVNAYVENNGSFAGNYVVAYGWIERWPQDWRYRTQVDVQVSWTDALGLLANYDLPESVWDYRIKQHVDAGRVVAWYRWGDEDNVAIDYSGNQNHGRYVVSSGTQHPTSSELAPKAVVKAGQSDAVIPACNRPGLSLGKMVAEAGQPATPPATGTWRFPSVVCSQATDLIGSETFSVETWVIHRAAFPLSVAGLASGTTSIEQWFAYWGDLWDSHGFGVSATGYAQIGAAPIVNFPNYTETYPIGFAARNSTTSIEDGQPHHVVLTAEPDGSGTGMAAKLYVDGVLTTPATPGADWLYGAWAFGYGYPAVIGMQRISTLSTAMGAGCIFGDFVFYNTTLTSTQINNNYRAGKWGRLSSSGDLTAADTFAQAISMLGYVGNGTNYFSSTDAVVAGGKINSRNAVDFIREAARSVDGAFFQEATGVLSFLSEADWKRDSGLGGTAVNFHLYDDNNPSMALATGYESCDFSFDDSLLTNSVTVSFDTGSKTVEDATSVAAYGREARSIQTMLVDPEEASALADFKVWSYKTPQMEIGEVMFDLRDSDESIQTIPYLRFGRRLKLTRTRPDGTQIIGEYWIQAVRHSISPDGGLTGRWQVTLELTPADQPGTPIIFDTTEFGSTTEFFWI